VVSALFADLRPAVWVSDMLASQRGHGLLWQVCLAHLLRDAQYALEGGDTRSVRRSGGCCCARSPSGGDERR
jgi:hypothetical protein